MFPTRATPRLHIHGLPQQLPEDQAAIHRSRLTNAAARLIEEARCRELTITISTDDHPPAARPAAPKAPAQPKRDDELSLEERAQRYQSRQPLYSFAQLILPEAVLEDLLMALATVEVAPKVFGEWGLAAIEPFPRTALNFYGPPGTGKTLAAHAIAQRLGRPILSASYADIESKYHGDGPKNVEALFTAAQRDGAVLFIDEADSLLSRRLTNVTQGSEQAINSMRSQLLISLQAFRGVVIFATNLVENYDQAFETRVRHISFPLPDSRARAAIWERHLPEQLPRADDVTPKLLAAHAEDVCGRDIKNAVIDAATRAAVAGDVVTLAGLTGAIDRIRAARIHKQGEVALSPEESAAIAQEVQAALAAQDGQQATS